MFFKRETLAEYQARMGRRLGYVPMVFATDGRFGPIRRWWDGHRWRR
jgi:hypothetical protein